MVTVAAGRSAPEVLAWTRETVEPALRAAVGELPASTRRIAEYHFGWVEASGGVAPPGGGGGKAIRPALTLLVADALGAPAGAAVPAAVAVELVHNFSLLHDDVMDGDLTRRHRPTAWSVFGTGAAILAGDALLTLAFDVLGAAGPGSGVAGPLGAAVHRLLDGQAADLAFERRAEVELAECVRMSEAKTGALLGCACAAGALVAEPAAVPALRGFGERLGLAFQFVDDILGIWGDPGVTGKPVHSDLARRKKSLPVVHTLTSGTPAAAGLAALYAGTGVLSTADLVQAAGLVEAAGSREWCQRRADELFAEALAELSGAGLDGSGRGELTALAGLMVRRDR